MKFRLFFFPFLLIFILNATETTILDSLTRTNISFGMDDKGNLNPNIFLPVYYGDVQQFYSSIKYSSSNQTQTSSIINFSDSKNALISSVKDITINYITYKHCFFGFETSFGLESSFSQVENNEFGYIHDSNDFFANGGNYYISFDNNIKLDIQRHAIRADVTVPIGKYFNSRFFTSISPYTTIGVNQTTIFKPLVNETGASSSSTLQDIAYIFRYDGQTKTGTLFDVGFFAYYEYQPIKYDIAQLARSGDKYVFQTNNINTVEVTTRYVIKLLLNIEILGGLNPSIGYGVENSNRINNVTNSVIFQRKNIFKFALEKLF